MRSAGWRRLRCSRWCATTASALRPRTAPDLAGFDLAGFLAGLRPAPSIFVRHTVGLVDALTRAETAGRRLDDGLPESLEEVIAAYGHRYFKLKVARRNRGRHRSPLRASPRCSTARVEPYWATLDGNEQYEEIGAVVALWRRIGEEPRLARLKSAILFVEQPIARAHALEKPVHDARARGADRDR